MFAISVRISFAPVNVHTEVGEPPEVGNRWEFVGSLL